MPGLPSLLAALGAVGLGFALVSFVIVLASGGGLASDLGWIGANLVIGIVLLVASFAMSVDSLRERMSSGEARRAGKYGTSAVVSTLLAVALLGMLGFLSTRYHHRFDWSEQKVHTLSDQSRQVLAGLTQDVEVTALVSAGDQGPVRDLLDRYAYESQRFRVTYADPNEHPGLLEQLKVDPKTLGERGLVRVAIGGESVEVSQIDEEHVTNAMVKLSRTGEKVVYFVQGHGESAIEGEDGAGRDGYARAAEALRNENYRIESLSLAQVPNVPDDADVVIVAGGKSRMFDEELASLDRYLARGGALLALVDPRETGSWIEKLRSWGADVGDDIVVDHVLTLFGRAAGTTPSAGEYAQDHPITKAFRDAQSDPVWFEEVRSVRGTTPDLVPIVLTSDSSWGERDVEKLYGERRTEADESDLAGPVPVMIAGTPTVTVEEGKPKPRLVVAGDTDFASNEFIDAGRDRDLFLNAANWLIGDVEAISVRPNQTRASRFQLTEQQFHRIRSLSWFLLPEAIAILGVFTWWTRRHPTDARR